MSNKSRLQFVLVPISHTIGHPQWFVHVGCHVGNQPRHRQVLTPVDRTATCEDAELLDTRIHHLTGVSVRGLSAGVDHLPVCEGARFAVHISWNEGAKQILVPLCAKRKTAVDQTSVPGREYVQPLAVHPHQLLFGDASDHRTVR